MCTRCERGSIDLLPEQGASGSSSASAGSAGQVGAGGSAGSETSAGGGKNGGYSGGGWEDNCPLGMDCTDGPDSDCPPNVEYCRRCDNDYECDGALPYCPQFVNHCVECLSEADCRDPTESHCDASTLRCMPGCSAESPTCPAERPFCDARRGACVACMTNVDCQGPAHLGQPICFAGECVECWGPTHCGPAKPHCFQFTCRECIFDRDCPSNQRCDDASGTCEGP